MALTASATLARMPSSLGYAILALVAAKAQSGYDIARQMKRPFGFFWQAKHGQIYPELARLKLAGLIVFEEIDHKIRPARKVYSVTSAGRAALATWIGQQPQDRAANDELVIKAYSLRRIASSAAITLLKTQIESHQSRLAALEQLAGAIEDRSNSSVRLDSPQFGNYAALRRAIGLEREHIAWCYWLHRKVVAQGRARRVPIRKRSITPARREAGARS
jgi:PadR family transcriptional regulator AphA